MQKNSKSNLNLPHLFAPHVIWIVAGWIVACLPAQAASYNCENNNLNNLTDIEIHICGEESISKQDEILASLYKKIQSTATKSQRNLLKADQQQWLHQVRNVCADRPCLGDAYRIRITKLEELIQDGWQIWVSDKESFTELSHRSGISESELWRLFHEDGYTQLAMNLALFNTFISVDLKMNKLLAQKIEHSLSSCSSELQVRQSAWEESRDRKCDQEADEEAEGGSMRPMAYSSCRAIATRERISYVKTLHSCEALR